MLKGYGIAIDGPAAAGKGTIAPLLAKRLNGFYLNTGAMYRCLGLKALNEKINLDDQQGIIKILSKTNIQFNDGKVFLNNEDVTERIKDQDIAFASSKVAVIKEVRQHLVKEQQKIAREFQEKGISVVAEGRDTATKVLPDADLKIFLTATIIERTKRRLGQLGLLNSDSNFQKILGEVKERDRRDYERDVDPLAKDPEKFGYFVLDSTDLSEEETLKQILEKVND